MFQDKVVVISGAGSGIGRELAFQLTEAGARVALSDINRAGLDETMKRLPNGSKAKG
ncbi:SDR family NAD(P)-dependent oxidoreductase [Pseudomonas paeninsulae]|uniref:SDR family NAD(P)-dependent oxidoreductase n=1 Tax=Pseudomonas paeninsulae TaxID=3110772 RepID=UPI002D780FA3|nr:SDR family NAD(P)-dependent oxidoreductase [Pseudomonas sp. IT1137]